LLGTPEAAKSSSATKTIGLAANAPQPGGAYSRRGAVARQPTAISAMPAMESSANKPL